MDSSKKTTVKLSRKIDLRGAYTDIYFWELTLSLIQRRYTSSTLPFILKENFAKPTRLNLSVFLYPRRGGLNQTRKANGFKSLRLKYWEINAKLIFGKNLQERSKTEKVNINRKFCIFKLVYSWGPNIKGGLKIENLIAGVGWRRFYLKI